MNLRHVLLLITASGLIGCSNVARRAVLPGSYLKPPSCNVSPGPGSEIVSEHLNDGSNVILQYSRSNSEQAHPDSVGQFTVLFCYGNRMSIAGSQGIVSDFRKLGLNVIVPEYPGYGMSGGGASEKGCYEAAEIAYNYLIQRRGVSPDRIIFSGLSVGSGVAVELARRHKPAGLILVVPISRIRDIANDDLSWYLRWAGIMASRYVAFDNLSKIDQVDGPVLVVEAKRDQVTSHTRTASLLAKISKYDLALVDSDHDGAWSACVNDVHAWLIKEHFVNK